MYIVEVVCASEGLSGPMASMRSWLDHHQVQPALFEFALLPNRVIRFRLQFRTSSEAAAFARAFKGDIPDGASAGVLAA